MLISHRKKFIFTKTVKTAGTSVESYYEPFCMAEGEWKESHFRDEYVSKSGVIGVRGAQNKQFTFFNHMPAVKIQEQVGEELWKSYFKFTVIRNPYAKLVSGWHFFQDLERRRAERKENPSWFKQLKKKLLREGRTTRAQQILQFRKWLLEEPSLENGSNSIIDRDKYLINGDIAVDYFIRQEKLAEGISHVNRVLGIGKLSL